MRAHKPWSGPGRQGFGLSDMHKQQGKRQIAVPSAAAGDASEVASADDNAASSAPATTAATPATSQTLVEQVSSQIEATSQSTAAPVTSSSAPVEIESSSAQVATSSSSSSSVIAIPTSSTQESTSIETTTSSRSTVTSTTTSTPTSSIRTTATPVSTSEVTESAAELSNSTNVHYITGSASASAASSGGSDDSPSTGSVIGIVAGGLVGVVVLAALLGYFCKARCSRGEDDDELADAAFNKDEFRRESVMLSTVDDRSDVMSLHSNSQAGTLSRSGTTALPGLGRANTSSPRPPSTFERHYYSPGPTPLGQQSFGNMGAPQPMNAGFEPGQVIPNYGGGYPQENLYGGAAYGQPQYYAQQAALQRQDTVASHYPDFDDAAYGVARGGSAQSQYADLHRQASAASSLNVANKDATASGMHNPYDQRLSGIAEDDMDPYGGQAHEGQRPGLARSGTLEDVNPQQTYF